MNKSEMRQMMLNLVEVSRKTQSMIAVLRKEFDWGELADMGLEVPAIMRAREQIQNITSLMEAREVVKKYMKNHNIVSI